MAKKELSKTDLALLDIAIADMKEKGINPNQKVAFWPLLVAAVRIAVQIAARTAICVTSPRSPKDDPLLNTKGELSLKDLLELRKKMSK